MSTHSDACQHTHTDLATTREVVDALRRVGFEVLEFSDLATETEVSVGDCACQHIHTRTP